MGDDQPTLAAIKATCAKGHSLLGIISSNPDIQHFADNNGINLYTHLPMNLQMIMASDFDYFFIFNNQAPLPKAFIKRCRGSILKSQYGVLDSSSSEKCAHRAIMDLKKNINITWQQVTEKSMHGPIVHSTEINIAQDDTAGRVITKLHNATLILFRLLLKKLPQALQEPETRKTNLYTKTQTEQHVPYYGFIHWNRRASDIYQLFRALSFLPHNNTLTTCKFFIGKHIYVPENIHISDIQSCQPPGTLTLIDQNILNIATRTNDICITSVQSIQGGQSLPIAEIIRFYDLKVGYQLAAVPHAILEKLSVLNKRMEEQEAYWVHYLQNPQQPDSWAGLETSEGPSHVIKGVLDADTLKAHTQASSGLPCEKYVLASLFFQALAHLAAHASFTLTYCDDAILQSTHHVERLITPSILLTIDSTPAMAIDDYILKLYRQMLFLPKKTPYARDIFSRYPALEKSPSTPLIYFEIIRHQQRPETPDHPVVISLNQKDLSFTITTKNTALYEMIAKPLERSLSFKSTPSFAS
jgi:methionyl-tRNA formyltransferase